MKAFWGLDHSMEVTTLLHMKSRDWTADELDLLANIGLNETCDISTIMNTVKCLSTMAFCCCYLFLLIYLNCSYS